MGMHLVISPILQGVIPDHAFIDGSFREHTLQLARTYSLLR